jgi:hypothetical protein
MKFIKHKAFIILLTLSIASTFISVTVSSMTHAFAASIAPPTCTALNVETTGACADCNLTPTPSGCVPNTSDQSYTTAPATTCGEGACDLVSNYLNPSIDLVSLLVGVVCVASIIMGGIQYSSSAGDPQKSARARGRIINTIIAFLAYLFLYAFLQFLIPGGLLHTAA